MSVLGHLAGILGLNQPATGAERGANLAPESDLTWEQQAEVFRHSYSEVLAFLKHEDDKIGRVLTALSFLTAAGVALFVFSSRTPNPFLLDGSSVDSSDLFFAIFMVSLVLSLLAILAAVDPTSQIPRFWGDPAFTHDSLLFYAQIRTAGLPWRTELHRRLAESFRIEAERLAKRAEHKVQRFADARAFVHIAIASLGLLGISRIGGFSNVARWWTIAALLVLVLFLPAWDFFWLHRHRVSSSRVSLAFFFMPMFTALALLLIPLITSHHRPQTVAVAYSIAALLTSRLSLRLLRSSSQLICASLVVALVGLGLGLYVLYG